MTKNKQKIQDKTNDPEHLRFVVGVNELDPRMLEFLPPELREIIQKEIGGGNGIPESLQEVEEKEEPKPKIKFDFDMVNCNMNLKNLFTKLKKSNKMNYTILLYGESGSGKSLAAQYLAQILGIPAIKKQASSIIDKWVGSTEKNIKAAFNEAKQKKAMLILDEADSFLFDRKYAQRDFECASTNELLTQLETIEYPVVLTTNLKSKLDKACLRRCLFKIKYDYMKENNIKSGIKTYFGKEFNLSKEQLKDLKYLTAGDFKVAKEKMDILENGKYTNKKIYEYLLLEQNEKDIKTSNSIDL